MKPVWILDADGIEFHNIAVNNIYRNSVVDEFIGNEKKLGVSAPRGLGKTFLLKAKRNAYQQKMGVLCLPMNSMVDTIHTPRFYRSSLSFFENYENWRTLWKISISISILKQLDEQQHINLNTFNTLSDVVVKLFSLNIRRAGEYFNYLISLDRKDINTIFYSAISLDSALSNVDFSVCMFIDRVDQALSGQIYIYDNDNISKASIGPRNADFWKYAQLALADAAYEIISYNTHIKIYFTIRSEALVNAPEISYNYQNMREYISDLRYSKEELFSMFKQYVEYENNENLYYPEEKLINPLKSFIGIEEIECKYVDNTKESVFQYILRHTFLRPRDIMDICYHLYVANLKIYTDEKLENQIRTIVNRESQVILETYISSTEQFLLGIKREHIEYLCQLLNTNVMNEKYIKYICNRLNENFSQKNITEVEEIYKNKNSEESLVFWCKFNCKNCEELHPFCQLFNIGLIGYAWHNRADACYIRFHDMERGKIGTNHVLPRANYYFLHPCLASKAEHARKSRVIGNDSFSFLRNVLVSGRTEINDTKFAEIDRHIGQALKAINDKRVFLSSTCFDLGEDRKRVDETLSESGFDVVRSDSAAFNTKLNEVHSHDHCIDEMLKCNLMVFLVGRRYGGVYRGKKYKWAVDEIIKQSNGQINEPSISLMEYYIARKNKKGIYVYVDYDVYNERMTYKLNKRNGNDFTPFFADNINIFHVIEFITNQNVNNWFRTYTDLDNLEELIRIDFNFFN